ncbi:MAG: hypothetical protein N3G74_01060 [Candidatus Micrarchaeota archaeon]|nr:hypothetical protein [Candidatus Micrarchaeota archaeon]
MNDDEIIKRKVTIRDIVNILNRPYKVKRIRLSKGAYNFLPKKALNTLNKMKINIEIIELKRGPGVKVDREKIAMLYKSDVNAYEISRRLKIPLRTVYYHIKQIKKDENGYVLKQTQGKGI